MDWTILASFMTWGILVGLVFSAIGAAGGILTSFGLITVFGFAEPNAVKPMTQIVVLSTTLVLVPGYLRRAALVVPLGLLLGAGGVVGSYAGSTLSTLYLSDMQTFRPLFGLLTLAVAAQITWQLVARRTSTRAAQLWVHKVTETKFSHGALRFRYGSMSYRIPLWSPVAAGMAIAATAAIFGVGGGFLLVPYMTVVLGLPMHIVPATAAIAIFMSLIVSISNFIALGAPVHMGTLTPLVVGAVIGALAGPHLNRHMQDRWLQAVVAMIVTVIGVKYTLL